MMPAIEIHAPALIHTPEMAFRSVMVYDSKDILINASTAVRAGISEHNNVFTVWFDDGSRRHHMNRVFITHQDAEAFLQSIYYIKD